MRLLFCAIVIMAVSFGATTSDAKPDANGQYMVLGTGGSSCGTWASDHSPLTVTGQAEDSWILGYVTAFNVWGAGTSNASGDTDNAGITSWVTNYCQAHPLDTVFVAARSLLVALASHH